MVCLINYTHNHTHSHLVTALPGPLLSEVLLSSPILVGEDGAPLAPAGQGFEFGIDPSEDPELAMVRNQTFNTIPLYTAYNDFVLVLTLSSVRTCYCACWLYLTR